MRGKGEEERKMRRAKEGREKERRREKSGGDKRKWSNRKLSELEFGQKGRGR
jgi:hypothetical protein